MGRYQRTTNRRERGSLKNAVGLYVKVQPENRDRAKQVADDLDVPLGALVDMLLERLEVDADGRLAVADRPVAPPRDQEALPLAG